jgi:hypothetical protein
MQLIPTATDGKNFIWLFSGTANTLFVTESYEHMEFFSSTMINQLEKDVFILTIFGLIAIFVSVPSSNRKTFCGVLCTLVFLSAKCKCSNLVE